jgi:hypothetical protein
MKSDAPLSPVSAAGPNAKATQPSVAPNAIVLTSGLSGSSVLAGLISQAGYWTGDKTFKKEYDTYENAELISLNRQLFQQAGYTGDFTMEFSQEAIDLVSLLKGRIDETPYREFLKKCDAHRPWVWKDPRLWVTIRFWAHLLPMENCRFILLTRNPRHTWVSATLRRQIRSFASAKRYELSIEESLVAFLRAEGLSCLRLTYEKVIGTPEEAIAELNSLLGTHLTVEDLKRFYRGPLYKAPRSSPVDGIKAMLIYLKNYSKRVDIEERKKARDRHS